MLEITRERSTMLRVELRAPQVEEPIAQPLVFRDLLLARHLKRQLSAADSTSRLSLTDLDLAVARAVLTLSRVRASTLPRTQITLSSFTVSAAVNASEFGVKRTCVTP
jgi:hypothetical protein